MLWCLCLRQQQTVLKVCFRLLFQNFFSEKNFWSNSVLFSDSARSGQLSVSGLAALEYILLLVRAVHTHFEGQGLKQ